MSSERAQVVTLGDVDTENHAEDFFSGGPT